MAADPKDPTSEDETKTDQEDAPQKKDHGNHVSCADEAEGGAPEKKTKSRRGRSPEEEKEKDPMDSVIELMQGQHFGRAAAKLTHLLKSLPDDPVLLHNLGVVYTEQSRWAEAEETFMAAFEAQKKAGRLNYATLFGLGTVLTEQGGMGKFLQAEALFRDCLHKAIEKEEKGVLETYRAFTSLGENLGLQKRWAEAAEAFQQSLDLGTRMFGKEHERNIAQAAMLARAHRLARLQKWMRRALWAGTAAVPVICAWMWKYVGGPSPGELFQFWPSQNATGLPNAASAMAADGVSAPLG